MAVGDLTRDKSAYDKTTLVSAEEALQYCCWDTKQLYLYILLALRYISTRI